MEKKNAHDYLEMPSVGLKSGAEAYTSWKD